MNRKPLRDDIFNAMSEKPKLLERDTAFTRVNLAMSSFVETFFDGMF